MFANSWNLVGSVHSRFLHLATLLLVEPRPLRHVSRTHVAFVGRHDPRLHLVYLLSSYQSGHLSWTHLQHVPSGRRGHHHMSSNLDNQACNFHSFFWRVSEASQRAVYARSSLEAEIRVDEQRHLHGEPVARLDSDPECVVGLSRVSCTMRAVTAFISLPLACDDDDVHTAF